MNLRRIDALPLMMEQSSSMDAEKQSRSEDGPISRKVTLQITAAVAEGEDNITPAKRCRLEDIPRDARRPSAVTPAPSVVSSLTPMKDKEAIRSLLMSEAGYDSSAASAVRKRLNYISWDDYFMAVAALSAHRSKDPLSPTGACIVDATNRIIGMYLSKALGYCGSLDVGGFRTVIQLPCFLTRLPYGLLTLSLSLPH